MAAGYCRTGQLSGGGGGRCGDLADLEGVGRGARGGRPPARCRGGASRARRHRGGGRRGGGGGGGVEPRTLACGPPARRRRRGGTRPPRRPPRRGPTRRDRTRARGAVRLQVARRGSGGLERRGSWPRRLGRSEGRCAFALPRGRGHVGRRQRREVGSAHRCLARQGPGGARSSPAAQHTGRDRPITPMAPPMMPTSQAAWSVLDVLGVSPLTDRDGKGAGRRVWRDAVQAGPVDGDSAQRDPLEASGVVAELTADPAQLEALVGLVEHLELDAGRRHGRGVDLGLVDGAPVLVVEGVEPAPLEAELGRARCQEARGSPPPCSRPGSDRRARWPGRRGRSPG